MKNYTEMSNTQLASLVRQFRRSRTDLTCENGHDACGCSTVRTMDGNAACFMEVSKEIHDRRDKETRQ